jgi:hypothetical protein
MQAAVHSPCDAPRSAYAWLELAQQYLQQNNLDQAKSALHQAATLAGDNADIYRGLMSAYRALGLASEAAIAEMAALAFEQQSYQQSALMLYNLGTMFLMTQRPLQAEKWLDAALRVDPELVVAHQNLASILETCGKKERARHHRDQAYRRQNVFIDLVEKSKLSVLVLCVAGTGNVPIEFLLPAATTTRIKWVMDYAMLEQADHFPAYDLVFNAMGDQDATATSMEVVQHFLQRCTKPVLNMPSAIARTSREQVAAMLQGIDGLVVPRTVRMPASASENALMGALHIHAIVPPLLARPVGSHGGDGLQLLLDAEELRNQNWDCGEYYFSAYRDFRSSDGYYRKYRMIFIDREPFAYHLAISDQWQVHYASADMLSQAWKRDEERRFLDDPLTVLGKPAMQALRTIGERMDLDFCGVDFSLLEDGRLLLFEANATMLVHLEQFHPELTYKNFYVQRILDAFTCMLQRRIGNSIDAGRTN